MCVCVGTHQPQCTYAGSLSYHEGAGGGAQVVLSVHKQLSTVGILPSFYAPRACALIGNNHEENVRIGDKLCQVPGKQYTQFWEWLEAR